jgi:hypothetical protein
VNEVIAEQIKEEEMWDEFYAEFSEAMYVDPAEIDFDIEFPMEQS